MRRIISFLVIARLIQRLINGSRPRGGHHHTANRRPSNPGQPPGPPAEPPQGDPSQPVKETHPTASEPSDRKPKS
ncbi:MAG: hypothetical protein ACXIUB_00410 [Wenzhouxiangella sp.]